MPDTPEPLTANRLVGYNLARIRKALALSQEEAAARLEPYLGTRWAKNVFSAAERSYAGKRVRQFTANEILAMALAFGVPVSYFLMPPRPADRPEDTALQSGKVDVTWPELLDALFAGPARAAFGQRALELPREERANVTGVLAALGMPVDTRTFPGSPSPTPGPDGRMPYALGYGPGDDGNRLEDGGEG